MIDIKRMLIATDFSENASHARERAQRLAHFIGAEVHLLHVLASRDVGVLLRDAPADHEALQLFLQRDQKVDEKEADHGTPPTVAALRYDPVPARAILAYAEAQDIDLIAMGTHGRTGLRRWVLGSVAEEVMRRAKCPVVTIRTGAEHTLPTGPSKSLLVPIDLAKPHHELLARAARLAATAGAYVDLLYVLEEPEALRLFEIDEYRAVLPQLAVQAREALCKLTEGFPDVPMRCHVVTGDPSHEIVRYADAQQADLIFLSTRGAARSFSGARSNVTARVMRTAPCAVFTLNRDGRAISVASTQAMEVTS